jgi:predicted enzyme related to lactoylglutathione lyase
MDGDVRAVMFFCERPKEVALWWAQLLDVSSDSVIDDGDFCWFIAGSTEYGFHPSDSELNPIGGSPVVYLATKDLIAAMERALTLGSVRHRGPLVISPERSIAQFKDPFGNIFGLDGS